MNDIWPSNALTVPLINILQHEEMKIERRKTQIWLTRKKIIKTMNMHRPVKFYDTSVSFGFTGKKGEIANKVVIKKIYI